MVSIEISALASEEQERAGRLLNAALDAGINFLDTAECYGVSEELIGQYVSHRRGEFILATKAGHVSGGCSGEPWTAQTVADSIDRSLVRMKTGYVDIVQLHAYDAPRPPPDEVVQAVVDAKEAGKTRFVGFSDENEEAEWAIESGLFDTLQTSFSLVDQRARYGLLQAARSKGVGIIGKRPIANAVWGKAMQGGNASDAGSRVRRSCLPSHVPSWGSAPFRVLPTTRLRWRWDSYCHIARWTPRSSARETRNICWTISRLWRGDFRSHRTWSTRSNAATIR